MHNLKKSIFLFLLFFIIGNLLSQTNQPTLGNIDRSLLLYYEAVEQGEAGYWEKAILKLDEANEYNKQDPRILLSQQLLYDILDGIIDDETGSSVFNVVVDLTFNQAKCEILFLDEALVKYPQYAIFYIYRGMINENLVNEDLALTDYTAALAKDQNIYYAYYLRGRIYAQQKKVESALNDFNQAIYLAPNVYLNYYERGKLYQFIGRYNDAIADYEKAHQLYPLLNKMLIESLKICEGYNNRGLHYLEQAEYQEAVTDFSTAIEWNSIFYEPYINRGIAYRNLGMYDSAISDFDYVIALDSTNIKGYLNRALTFKKMGEEAKAEQDLLRTIEINPHAKQAYQDLGEMYYQQRQFDLAIEAFENVLAADSADYWGYYWLALAYDVKRRYPEAIKAYEAFIFRAPERYYDHKVKMYERAERLKEWLAKRRKKK